MVFLTHGVADSTLIYQGHRGNIEPKGLYKIAVTFSRAPTPTLFYFSYSCRY